MYVTFMIEKIFQGGCNQGYSPIPSSTPPASCPPPTNSVVLFCILSFFLLLLLMGNQFAFQKSKKRGVHFINLYKNSFDMQWRNPQ